MPGRRFSAMCWRRSVPAVYSLPMNLTDWLPTVEALTRRAGEVVMAIYATDFAVQGKADASPVTLADQQAEAEILAGLRALTPDIPIVAEEAMAAGDAPQLTAGGRFWLVDPLDGTREFVVRNGEFTVNIALIEQGRPVLGVVLAPAVPGPGGVQLAAPGGCLYAGIVGQGAWAEDATGRRAIHCRSAPPEGLTVLASRSHGDEAALQAFLAGHLAGRRVARLGTAGSSLKLCLLAAGQADLYPRLGRTMEWDIAAGHAVLAAAGGSVCRVDDGGPLVYGKPGFENPHFFARGLIGP
jgi:3'(2'), 5'-bisphosphate nucleotidase